MPSKFKYRERSEDTVRARAQGSGGDWDSMLSSSVPMIKIKEGENNLRILPPTWDFKEPLYKGGPTWGDNWAIEVWLHRDIGPDENTYLCLAKMKGKPCPICEARRDEEDDERAKKLKAGRRLLAYVINRDDEKAGPQIWSFGTKLERNLQVRSQDKKTGAILPIDHHEEGYDICFTRKGSNLNTEYYGEEIAREATPLSEKASKQDAWLQFVSDNPLPSLLIYYDYDHIQSVFMGKVASKADKDEEDDKPTRSSRNKKDEDDDKPAKKSKEPTEEEVDEMDEDELEVAIKKFKLDVDLDDFKTLTKKRVAVWEALSGGEDKSAEQDPEPETKKKAHALPTEEEVDEMDEDELAATVKKFKLDVDLDEFRSLTKKRMTVWEAIEKEDEIPSKGKGRAQVKDDDDDPGKEKDEDDVAGRARKKLERLKPRGRE